MVSLNCLKYVPSPWRRRLMWVAILFVCYSLVGFFLLPAIIKWQLVKQLPGITKRQAAVQKVRFNPYTLSLTIRGLSLTEPTGTVFASWEEFYVNFQASSLFRWAYTFKEIRLVKPFGEVILFKDGTLNLANMFENTTPTPPKPKKQGKVPRVGIFNLQITNGFVVFEDRTRRSPFRTEYRPINLKLTGFTTRPDAENPYSFHAESDAGRSVDWAGNVTVQPLGSSGKLAVTGINLRRYQPYLEDFTRAVLTNGLSDVGLSYNFSAGTNGVDLIVTNGYVRAEHLELQDPDNGENVVAVEGFGLEQGGLNFRERSVRVGSIKVNAAEVRARLSKGGKLNLLGLVNLPTASTNSPGAAVTNAIPSDAAPPFTITADEITVAKARVLFEDLTRRTPFKTELNPIEVSLKNVSTKPGSEGSYNFHIDTEATETVSGTGMFSINPVQSRGEVKLGTVEVKKYLPYLEESFRGKISAGKFEVVAPYRFALATNLMLAGVSNLSVKLTDLEIKAPGSDETVSRLKELAVERVDASYEERKARVGRVRTTGGYALARRQKDGSLNLLELLPPRVPVAGAPATAAKPGDKAVAEKPATDSWVVNVDEVVLDDYTVKVEDNQAAKPVTFIVDKVAANIKGVSTVSNTPIQAQVSLRFNETCNMSASGTAKVAPIFADLTIGVTNLHLRPFQPYVDQHVRLGILSAAVSLGGKAHYEPGSSGALATFKGGVQITNFATADQVAFKDFVKWDDLSIKGIDFAHQPDRLKVEEVSLSGLKTSVLIGADKKPNFASIMRKEASGTNAPSQPGAKGDGVQTAGKPAAETFPMEIGAVVLNGASFSLTDNSISPPASVAIQELSGAIKGLSSAMDTRAEVDLAGKVDQQAPFAIRGTLNPMAKEMFVDLLITNRNTQLTPFTPYLEKYAGHPLNKGRLSTTLRYHIEKNQLKAENKIEIDQLMLGARNDSPDATSLPVKLGIALLKDRNGRIELDVPVEGRLDDPKFRVGPIILKVVVNLLAKAATSPFKMLGALVGGGEEMSFVEFAVGSTNVTEAELEKLGKLSKALVERPAVNLEIEGAVEPTRDREALALQRLREELKVQRLQELATKGGAPQSTESWTIEPEEQARLLRTRFVETFGTNFTAILQTNELYITMTNNLSSTNQLAASQGKKSKRALFKGIGETVADYLKYKPKNREVPLEERLNKTQKTVLQTLTPELMETLLAKQVQISDADFQALMKARAQWVQNYLSNTGQIAGDRLFLVTPKPVDEKYKGSNRVNLSLN